MSQVVRFKTERHCAEVTPGGRETVRGARTNAVARLEAGFGVFAQDLIPRRRPNAGIGRRKTALGAAILLVIGAIPAVLVLAVDLAVIRELFSNMTAPSTHRPTRTRSSSE